MAEPAERERPTDPRLSAVLQAISDYDLTQSQAWNDLDALSGKTSVDDIEADPEGIIFSDDTFKGVMSVLWCFNTKVAARTHLRRQMRSGASLRDTFRTILLSLIA